MGAGWQRWWWGPEERLRREIAAAGYAGRVRNDDPFRACALCGSGEVVETAERRIENIPVGVRGRMWEFIQAHGRCRRCGFAHVWTVSSRCLDNHPFNTRIRVDA